MPRSLTDVLRAALKGRREAIYAIARETGISYATLWRFRAGQTTMKLDTADTLCRYLSLSLYPTRTKEPECA